MNYPLLVFAASLAAQSLAAGAGDVLRSRVHHLVEEERDDFGIILGATLTLLGLLLGFSFSMAISRYDQRKNYEEAEANAIGREYVRADLLPAGDVAKVKQLLRKYLDERVLFYTTRDQNELVKINAATAEPESVVGRCAAGGDRAAHACHGPCTRWHERRVELARIHTSGVVEPHPHCSVGADGGYRSLLQRVDRLRSTAKRLAYILDPANCRILSVLSDSRH